MIALRSAACLLPFLSLQTASALAVAGDVDVKRSLDVDFKRSPDVVPFPPSTPISIDLNTITEDGAISDLWLPATIKGKQLKLLLDTGSIPTWAMTQLIEDELYAQSPKYILEQSDLEGCEKGAVTYSDGTAVSGLIIKKDVMVSTCQRSDFKFIAVNEISYDHQNFFSKYELSGVFGASAFLGTDGAVEPWLARTRFSVQVDPAGTSKLTFGLASMSSTATAAVIPTQFSQWVFESPNVGKVLVDTGSNYVRLPEEYLDDYNKQLQGLKIKTWPPQTDENDEPNWYVACGAALPDMNIPLKKGSVEVFGKYLIKPYNKKDPKGRCGVWFNVLDDNGDVEGILGMPFLTGHVVTFDSSAPELGFSKL